jgi:hypothetical protein
LKPQLKKKTKLLHISIHEFECDVMGWSDVHEFGNHIVGFGGTPFSRIAHIYCGIYCRMWQF